MSTSYFPAHRPEQTFLCSVNAGVRQPPEPPEGYPYCTSMWITGTKKIGGSYYYGAHYHPCEFRAQALIYMFSKYPMYMRDADFPAFYDYSNRRYHLVSDMEQVDGGVIYSYTDGYEVNEYDPSPSLVIPYLYYYKGDYPILLTGSAEYYVYYDDSSSVFKMGNVSFENLEPTTRRSQTNGGYPKSRNYWMHWDYDGTSDRINSSGLRSFSTFMGNGSISGNLDDPSAWNLNTRPRADHQDYFNFILNPDWENIDTETDKYYRNGIAMSPWNTMIDVNDRSSGFKFKSSSLNTKAVNISNPNFMSYEDWFEYCEENF